MKIKLSALTLSLIQAQQTNVPNCESALTQELPCSQTYEPNIKPFLDQISGELLKTTEERAQAFNNFYNRNDITVAQKCLDDFFVCAETQSLENDKNKAYEHKVNMENLEYLNTGVPGQLMAELSENLKALIETMILYGNNPTGRLSAKLLDIILAYEQELPQIDDKWRRISGMLNFKLGRDDINVNIFAHANADLFDNTPMITAMKKALSNRSVKNTLESLLANPLQDILIIYDEAYAEAEKTYYKDLENMYEFVCGEDKNQIERNCPDNTRKITQDYCMQVWLRTELAQNSINERAAFSVDLPFILSDQLKYYNYPDEVRIINAKEAFRKMGEKNMKLDRCVEESFNEIIQTFLNPRELPTTMYQQCLSMLENYKSSFSPLNESQNLDAWDNFIRVCIGQNSMDPRTIAEINQDIYFFHGNYEKFMQEYVYYDENDIPLPAIGSKRQGFEGSGSSGSVVMGILSIFMCLIL